MVDSELFKRYIEQLISQDYKVEFLGNNFNQIAELLTETKAEKIYAWIQQVIEKQIQPIFMGSDKAYKEWQVHHHLGDHHYYDKVRKDLDLKKSSY